MLDKDQKSYLYIHDLAVQAQEHVVVGVSGQGPRSFKNAFRKVKNIRWTDNGAPLEFAQNPENGLLCVDCTGYSYGENLVVRVAEIEYEN